MDEIFRLDHLPPLLRSEGERPRSGADVDRKKSLLLEVVAYLVYALADDNGCQNLAVWIRILAVEFHIYLARRKTRRYLALRRGRYCPSPWVTSTPAGISKSNND